MGLFYLAGLADDDVIAVDDRPWMNNAVNIKLIIGANPASLSSARIRSLKQFILVLGVGVRPKERRSEKSSVDTRLVEHDGVLLVVASVAGDCDDSVTAGGKLFEMEELHALCADERLLGVVEDMSHRVHS